jgi:hypothetical protein
MLPEMVLNQPHVRALVGEREAAGVAQHVGMRVDRQVIKPVWTRTFRLWHG